MAWTQDDIDRLKKMMATGALRGRFDNRDVTFRSLEEMNQLLSQMEAEVAAGCPMPKRTRAFRFVTDKGLGGRRSCI
jgi:hypothetical protein